MLKIKAFDCEHEKDLERAINEFIKEISINSYSNSFVVNMEIRLGG